MLVHYTDLQIAMIVLGPLQWVTNGYRVYSKWPLMVHSNEQHILNSGSGSLYNG